MKSSIWLAGLAIVCAASVTRAAERAPLDTTNLPQGWAWPPSAPMRARSTGCLKELAEARVPYVPVSDVYAPVLTPVVVPGARLGEVEVRSVATGRAPAMDCEMALALARESPALAALGVRTLLVGRVIHDRPAVLRGRPTRLRSRHALGLAVDVRAVITQRGKRLTVLRDYRHPLMQRLEAVLLSSPTFRAVVTPRNDAAHRDHFHLSAKLTLNPALPEPSVDVRQLLAGQ